MTIETRPQGCSGWRSPSAPGFDDFRDRYERSVPILDAERFAALVREGVDWIMLCAVADDDPRGRRLAAVVCRPLGSGRRRRCPREVRDVV
jgi:hypothetical protein